MVNVDSLWFGILQRGMVGEATAFRSCVCCSQSVLQSDVCVTWFLDHLKRTDTAPHSNRAVKHSCPVTHAMIVFVFVLRSYRHTATPLPLNSRTLPSFDWTTLTLRCTISASVYAII